MRKGLTNFAAEFTKGLTFDEIDGATYSFDVRHNTERNNWFVTTYYSKARYRH